MGGDPPSLDESRLSFATRRGRATSHESGTPESDQNVTWECPEPRTVALEPAGVVAGAEECLPGAVRRSGRSPPIAPGACWRSGGPRTDALVVGSGTGSGASGGSARQGAMDTAIRTRRSAGAGRGGRLAGRVAEALVAHVSSARRRAPTDVRTGYAPAYSTRSRAQA
jgi:hypothetical protein